MDDAQAPDTGGLDELYHEHGCPWCRGRTLCFVMICRGVDQHTCWACRREGRPAGAERVTAMKMLVLLDREDLALLTRGLPFELQVGAGPPLTLQVQQGGNGHRTPQKRTPELRAKILAELASSSVAEVAAKYHVSRDTIYGWRTKALKAAKAAKRGKP